MWFSVVLATSTASLLLLGQVDAAGLYTKNSPVIQVDANSYDKLIARSNYTSVSDFDPLGDILLIEFSDSRVLCTMVRALSEPQTYIRKGSQKSSRTCKSCSNQL
jgi:hypothetical protein